MRWLIIAATRSRSGLSTRLGNRLDRSIGSLSRSQQPRDCGRSKIRVLIKRSTSDASAISKQTEARRGEPSIEGDYNGVTQLRETPSNILGLVNYRNLR